MDRHSKSLRSMECRSHTMNPRARSALRITCWWHRRDVSKPSLPVLRQEHMLLCERVVWTPVRLEILIPRWCWRISCHLGQVCHEQMECGTRRTLLTTVHQFTSRLTLILSRRLHRTSPLRSPKTKTGSTSTDRSLRQMQVR